MNLGRKLSLSWEISKIEFKLRSRNSLLGFLLQIINPLIFFFFLFAIFYDRLGKVIPSYESYLFLGIIMFNFFQRTTGEATSAIISNGGVIKSINFPREVFINLVIIKNLYTHIIDLLLFSVIIIFFQASLYPLLFYIPLLVVFSIFIFGCSLIISSITVFFREFGTLWSLSLRLLWFITPIFYAIEGQQRLFLINLLNPLYYFITAGRDLVIYSRLPELYVILAILCYTLLSLICGIVIFNKLKDNFAEKS